MGTFWHKFEFSFLWRIWNTVLILTHRLHTTHPHTNSTIQELFRSIWHGVFGFESFSDAVPKENSTRFVFQNWFWTVLQGLRIKYCTKSTKSSPSGSNCCNNCLGKHQHTCWTADTRISSVQCGRLKYWNNKRVSLLCRNWDLEILRVIF